MPETTTTSVTAVPEVFSYRDVPDSDLNSVALGETVFQDVSQVVTAGGAGNDQRFQVTCPLPRNYAYVVADAYIRMFSGVDNIDLVWDLCAFAQFRNSASPTSEVGVPACAAGRMPALIDARAQMLWNWKENLPGLMLRPQTPGSTQEAKFHLHCATEAQASTVVSFYFRFWHFGVLQSHNWEANNPGLVR